MTPRPASTSARLFVRRRARAVGLTAGLLGSVVAAIALPMPAFAAAAVDAVDANGMHLIASADSATELTVSGSGFQSIEAGFGGIYLMFGTVSGDGWQPSVGGTSGVDYSYVADDPDAPAGFQQFIAFPGGSTSGEASGGLIAADGSWSATLTIPGAQLEVTDSSGTVTPLDCAVETCGIITIGAHGVVNANNETFTQISFDAPSAVEPSVTPTPEMSEVTPEPEMTTLTIEGSDDASSTSPLNPAAIAVAAAVVILGAGAVAAIVVLRRRRYRAGANATDQ